MTSRSFVSELADLANTIFGVREVFPGQPLHVLPCNHMLYVALNRLYTVVFEARDSVNIWQCYGLVNENSRECSATFPGYIDSYTAHRRYIFPRERGLPPTCYTAHRRYIFPHERGLPPTCYTAHPPRVPLE